jgi:hypothetical protein
MHKGITPTITLTLPDDIDLTFAQNVYVTLADPKTDKKWTKTGQDLTIDQNVIQLSLEQQETLAMQCVAIQVNWTYIDGTATKRACSDIVRVYFSENLEPRVLA